MTMLSFFVSLPTLLPAFTVKVNVPAVVGVPEMVLPERVKPAGRLPLSMLQVMGAAPVAARVWLYASPTLPPDRVVVVMAGFSGAETPDNPLA